MHRTLALTLLVLSIACYDSADAPPEPTPTPRDDLRVLGGAVVCEACSEFEFTIGGPDLRWVVGASFVDSDDARLHLPAQIELRRFTGDSGIVLQARAWFTGAVPVGEYDLELLTPGRPDGAESMLLRGAMRVTRAVTPPATPIPPTTPPPVTPPPPSAITLRIAVTVTGADPDTHFSVSTPGCDDYYGYSDCIAGAVSPGRPFTVSLGAGTFSFMLTDVEPNCLVTSPNPASVTVVADSTTDLNFAVTCSALGYISVSVPVTGADRQEYFTVGCEGNDCAGAWVLAPGPVVLRLAPGAYRITLPSSSLRSNCRVTGPDVVAVQVTGGATVTVQFPVECVPFGEIRVSVAAPDPVHEYRVENLSDCDYYYGCPGYPLRPGFPATIRVPAGSYALQLVSVPTNCRVTSPNPANAIVTSGATTELLFEVACP